MWLQKLSVSTGIVLTFYWRPGLGLAKASFARKTKEFNSLSNDFIKTRNYWIVCMGVHSDVAAHAYSNQRHVAGLSTLQMAEHALNSGGIQSLMAGPKSSSLLSANVFEITS